MLNRLGVDHECDGRTDGRTDSRQQQRLHIDVQVE